MWYYRGFQPNVRYIDRLFELFKRLNCRTKAVDAGIGVFGLLSFDAMMVFTGGC